MRIETLPSVYLILITPSLLSPCPGTRAWTVYHPLRSRHTNPPLSRCPLRPLCPLYQTHHTSTTPLAPQDKAMASGKGSAHGSRGSRGSGPRAGRNGAEIDALARQVRARPPGNACRMWTVVRIQAPQPSLPRVAGAGEGCLRRCPAPPRPAWKSLVRSHPGAPTILFPLRYAIAPPGHTHLSPVTARQPSPSRPHRQVRNRPAWTRARACLSRCRISPVRALPPARPAYSRMPKSRRGADSPASVTGAQLHCLDLHLSLSVQAHQPPSPRPLQQVRNGPEWAPC